MAKSVVKKVGKKSSSSSKKKPVATKSVQRYFSTAEQRQIQRRRANITTGDKNIEKLIQEELVKILQSAVAQSCLCTGAEKRKQVTAQDFDTGIRRVKGVSSILAEK
jgi:hypothetical protein